MRKSFVGGVCLLIFFLAAVEGVPAKTPAIGVSTGHEPQRSQKTDEVTGGGAGEKIVIGGTGDSQELLRSLASAFQERFGGNEIEVPDSIGSSGGIKALLSGQIDLARVARPLTENEEKLGLIYLPLAENPVVFAVHPGLTGIDSITAEQIVGIYSGKIESWHQLDSNVEKGRLYPVLREAGDSCRNALNKHLAGFKDIKNPAGNMVYTTPKTVAALARHKATIGFLPLSATVNTDLRILKLNGIYPSVENLRSGRYKLVVSNGLVYKGELDGRAKRFVDFIHSEIGRRIIIEYGAVPSL